MGKNGPTQWKALAYKREGVGKHKGKQRTSATWYRISDKKCKIHRGT